MGKRLSAVASRVLGAQVRAGHEDGSEPLGGLSVTGRVGERVRTLGAGEIPSLLQQRPKVEGTVLVAAPLGAPVAGLRGSQVPTCLVEDAQVQCGPRVAKRVGFAVRTFGGRRIPSLLEQDSKAEPFNGRTGAVGQFVLAPQHLPAFPNRPGKYVFGQLADD